MGKNRYFTYILLVLSFSCLRNIAQDQILDSVITVQFNSSHFIECLHDISNQCGITFGYRKSLIDTIENVTFRSNGTTLKYLLDTLCIPRGIGYTYNNNQILLKKRKDKIYLKGCILSSTDSLAISYATLSLKGKSSGTIADYKGVYQWELSEKCVNDTVIISSMGYSRKYLTMKELLAYNSAYLFLGEAPIKIDTVFIRNKKSRIDVLGNKGNRASGSIYLDTHGQQTGLHMENKTGNEGFLLTVSTYLVKDGNLTAPFRLRIYTVDSMKGIPVNDVLDEILIVKPKGEEGWFEIDVSQYNLIFPERGLFIAVEGIFPNEYEYYLGSDEFTDIKNKNLDTPIEDNKPLSISYGQQIGYNRRLSDRTWHYSLSHTWFQLRKQQNGVLIKAAVSFEKQKRKKKKKNETDPGL